MYKTYGEIPAIIKSYIVVVADVLKIEDVPLEDINGLLETLEEESDYEELDRNLY